MLVPLAVLVLSGHVPWTPYAAFGAFTSLYGRRENHASRMGMQAAAGLCLTLSVLLGVAVSLTHDGRVLSVILGSVVAAGGYLLSGAFDWHPPGPLFMVFGFAVCAIMPATGFGLLIAAGVAGGSALLAMLIGHAGSLREPKSWRRPQLRMRSLRSVLGMPGVRSDVVRYLIATPIAGGIGMAMGGTHPYWAMVAVVVAMSGPDLRSRLTRASHRVVGTLVGLLVAAAILSPHPTGLAAVGVIAVLQVAAEMLIGRNYSLALLAITPLALMMGQLAHPVAVGPMLADRFLETLLGATVGVVALLVPDYFPGRRSRSRAPQG
ncbi:FUSC family protein [Leekyejoonella antrihumi]|uniref:FUSC family protein n=2 Tax=Leekyejoonella antrihumi TaxID=1660198 RepID=A0A563DZU0_9MICO|nr:FUSC family protein [Leekyejoonella antrihumi]